MKKKNTASDKFVKDLSTLLEKSFREYLKYLSSGVKERIKYNKKIVLLHCKAK
jgi:hypothetical protein